MNLKELLEIEEEVLACPTRSKNPMLIALLEDRISSERAKALAADNDPVLNARIERCARNHRRRRQAALPVRRLRYIQLYIVPYGRIHKLGDSLKIPLVLVPMLRVGVQGAALRADIPKAKFVRQISVPQLMDAPVPYSLPPGAT